ncbi:MAG: CBS domain-containing protein [Enterobacterales bacterium]|jgi:CBS domain-containing protein
MSIQNNQALLVREVMLSLANTPVISEKVILKEALEEMSRSRIGIVCIIDEQAKLLGVLTDGDIRRKLLKVQKPFSAFFVDDALEHAIQSPTSIQPDDRLIDAIQLMGEKQIWDLPVTDSKGALQGLLHLHPAIQALMGMEA